MIESQKRMMIWIAASVFLIILAEFLPNFTVLFVLLILSSVVLLNSTELVSFINELSKGLAPNE